MTSKELAKLAGVSSATDFAGFLAGFEDRQRYRATASWRLRANMAISRMRWRVP